MTPYGGRPPEVPPQQPVGEQPPQPEGRKPLDSRQKFTLAVVAVAVVAVLVVRDVVSANTVVLLALLFGSVILHEVSHGVVALQLGDDTAKRAGRITLNPVSHVDPFGTIILPVILVLVGASPFGWAKPVPVTPSRLRSPRNHSLLVSLAGPATNIVLALMAALALRSVLPGPGFRGELPFTTEVLISFGLVNVFLAAFNLIPIPPLDGSAVVERLLPAALWPGYLKLRQYSMVILLVLVFALPGSLGRVFDPAVRFWANLIV